MQLDSVELPPELPPELPWELLDRYLTNEVSDEERASVDAYLRRQPAVATSVRALFDGVIQQGITDPGVPRDDVWNNIRVRTSHAEISNAHKSPRTPVPASPSGPLSQRLPSVSRLRSRLWMTVATLGLVITGGYTLLHTPSIQTRLFSANDRPDIRRLSTAKGQRASIELTDGTKITLNVASTITVPPEFGERDRVIYLNGEALFDVPVSTGKPFIVKTATSSTRVLGTRFTVRQYNTDQNAVTTVTQGKVDVAGTVLTAGQRGLQARDGHILVSAIDTSVATDWATGRITFYNTALQDVIAELNRWYDTEFVLDDTTLAAEPVTLRFHNRSADEVAAVLNDILGTRYRKNGARIIITR